MAGKTYFIADVSKAFFSNNFVFSTEISPCEFFTAHSKSSFMSKLIAFAKYIFLSIAKIIIAAICEFV